MSTGKGGRYQGQLETYFQFSKVEVRAEKRRRREDDRRVEETDMEEEGD